MDSFQGHFLLGIFCLSFGTWWTSQIPRRYLLCQKRGTQFFSSAIYPCCRYTCIDWPLEAIIKIIATSAGLVVELFASTDYGKGPGIVSLDDLKLVTIYLFFCISGIIEVFMWRGTVDVANLDYLIGALAFGVEGIIVYSQLSGEDNLDCLVHSYLMFAILGCVVSTLIEMTWRHSLAAAVGRPFSVLLQGTWLIQTALILYNPSPGFSHWDEQDARQMTLVTLLFTWHLIGVIIAMTVITIIARGCIKKVCPLERGVDFEMVGWPPEMPFGNNISEESPFTGDTRFITPGESSDTEGSSVDIFNSRTPLT